MVQGADDWSNLSCLHTLCVGAAIHQQEALSSPAYICGRIFLVPKARCRVTECLGCQDTVGAPTKRAVCPLPLEATPHGHSMPAALRSNGLGSARKTSDCGQIMSRAQVHFQDILEREAGADTNVGSQQPQARHDEAATAVNVAQTGLRSGDGPFRTKRYHVGLRGLVQGFDLA